MATIISIVGEDNMLRSQNDLSQPSLFAFCQPCDQSSVKKTQFINWTGKLASVGAQNCQ